MRKVTTRYVLTINPYQIVRENWVVGKILSLVLSLCFFFKKKSTNSVGTPERDKFCSATTSRSVAKEIWLVENEYPLSLVRATAGFSFFQNFFFPFLSFFFGGFSPLFFAFFAFFCSPLWPFVDFLIKKNMSTTQHPHTPTTKNFFFFFCSERRERENRKKRKQQQQRRFLEKMKRKARRRECVSHVVVVAVRCENKCVRFVFFQKKIRTCDDDEK